MNHPEHMPRDASSADARRADAELRWMREAQAEDDVLAVVEGCVRRRRRGWWRASAALALVAIGSAGLGWFGPKTSSIAVSSVAAAPTATVLAPEIRTLP